MAKITITVSRDPSKGTKIAVEGHAGPGCKALTDAVEKALGQVTQTHITGEFNQAPQVAERQRQTE